MSKFKFAFRTRVTKPGGTAQAVVTGHGQDMEHGRYYTLEWMTDSGRPASWAFWEGEMLAANPPAKPKAKAKRKAKRSKSSKRR